MKFLRIIIGLAILFSSRYALSADARVTANVSQTQVALGDVLQLTVTVSDGKNIPNFDLPKMDGFDAQFVGPSTRISIINGQYSSSRAFVYNLLPLKIGKFKIPAINLTVDEKSYTTEPIDVEVVSSGTAPSPGQASNAAQPEVSLKDKIFMVVKPSKAEVYVNEAVPLKILLYISGLSLRDIQYPEFDKSNFVVEDYKQPKQYSQVMNGINYDVVEFETVLYPAKSGDLKIGPASVGCSLLYRNQNAKSPFDQFDSFFDDSFFPGFNYSKRPVRVESLDAPLKVLDLPEANKPMDFSGAVGDFKFAATLNPQEVKVGDPITVKMKVSGEGNLKAFELPHYKDLNGFKIYDPQTKEEGGSKRLEQVLIPQSANVKEIPAIKFSYFDPTAKAYKTLPQGPFPITVKPLPKEEQSKVVGASRNELRMEEPQEIFGADIVYIKPELGMLHKRGDLLYHRPLYWILLLTCFGLWALGLFYFEHKNRLTRDSYYARRMLAPKQAKQGLALAKKSLEESDLHEVYDVLLKTLQRYFSDKYKISHGEMTGENLETRLKQYHLDPERMNSLRSFLEEADLARYASLSLTEEQAKKSIDTVESFIDAMERKSK